MSEKNQNKGAAYRQSVIVAIVLAVLTVIEYFVAVEFESAILLMLIALFKAVHRHPILYARPAPVAAGRGALVDVNHHLQS